MLSLRKKPSQLRSQATVDVLIEAAAQLLEANPDGASTNRIAERAGFSIGTLYQYFPNADAILAAMAEREQKRIANALSKTLGELDPDEPEAAVRAALRLFLGAFDGRQTLRRQVALRLLSSEPAFLRHQATLIDQTFGEVLASIEEKFPGRLRPLDPMARFVLTRSITGAVRSAVMEGQPSLRDPNLENELVCLTLRYAFGPS